MKMTIRDEFHYEMVINPSGHTIWDNRWFPEYVISAEGLRIGYVRNVINHTARSILLPVICVLNASRKGEELPDDSKSPQEFNICVVYLSDIFQPVIEKSKPFQAQPPGNRMRF